MTCYVEVGDMFVWTDDYKGAREGDTTVITDIAVDEDAVAWVDIVEDGVGKEESHQTIAATDIQEKVEDGLLAKE